jgi:DNA-directed RNA polymerase specialized sigma24 family protein
MQAGNIAVQTNRRSGAMHASSGNGPSADAEALYRRFLELLADVDRQALLEEVLFHPISRDKLRSAAAAVLRDGREGDDRHADLMQEAALNVVGRFRIEEVDFEPRGVDPFLGWLWKVWHNACLYCWRTMRGGLKRQPDAAGRLVRVPQPDAGGAGFADPRFLQLVLRAIQDLPSQALRDALHDWLNGLNGAESADRRGVSKGAISKRRRRGAALLRKRLPSADDLDAG